MSPETGIIYVLQQQHRNAYIALGQEQDSQVKQWLHEIILDMKLTVRTCTVLILK